jgi:type IV pilus assembly protein PilW
MSAVRPSNRGALTRPLQGSRCTTRAPAQARRGLSLIEVMVSLALGLIVVGAGVTLLASARVANTVNDNLSRVSDAVRMSYDQLAREVREAGASPCDSQLATANVLSNFQGASPTWWAVADVPVQGFDDVAAFAGAPIGTAVGERVNGTDAIVVRYSSTVDGVRISSHATASTRFTTTVANHGLGVGDIVSVCNFNQEAVFQVSAVDLTAGTFNHNAGVGSPGNCSGGLGLPTVCTSTGTVTTFLAGASVGRVVAAGWYIGNNGRAETGGRSLYRVTRTGAEEVAEGINDMQINYLTLGATDYVAASAITDWSLVTAVRFDITYQSPETGVSTRGNAQRLMRTVGFTTTLRNLQP